MLQLLYGRLTQIGCQWMLAMVCLKRQFSEVCQCTTTKRRCECQVVMFPELADPITESPLNSGMLLSFPAVQGMKEKGEYEETHAFPSGEVCLKAVSLKESLR